MTNEGLDRRQALAGAAIAGIGLPLLAACGGGGSSSDGSAAQPTDGGSDGGSDVLGPTADVVVGGGVVYPDQKVVVTQPTKGDFKGFTAVCTHQGCTVGSVSDGTINCPCHGSQYSIEDGSVQAGPAPSPLAPVDITVKGGEIALA